MAPANRTLDTNCGIVAIYPGLLQRPKYDAVAPGGAFDDNLCGSVYRSTVHVNSPSGQQLVSSRFHPRLRVLLVILGPRAMRQNMNGNSSIATLQRWLQAVSKTTKQVAICCS